MTGTSGVVVTGWSAITSAGVGADALAKRLSLPDLADPAGNDVGDLYEEPLPATHAHALPDFSQREHLGRKGTSTYDRATGLAVVCCQEALASARLAVDDDTRARVGVVLGTSLGSFKSTSDYSRDTLVRDKPYLVNPMLFPNSVMNCAAGQVAIRFGLRGVNATIAGGALAFLNVLRYAANAVDRGHADVVVAGAVEEFTPHRAWAGALTGATERVPLGEAAGVFVLARPDAPDWAGRARHGEVLAVATGFGPGGTDRAEDALTGCVQRVLASARVDPDTVPVVYTGEPDRNDRREFGPVARALGRSPERVLVKDVFGECDAASGAVALAVLLATDPAELPGSLALLTARGADGAVGAAIVRRHVDDDADRG